MQSVWPEMYSLPAKLSAAYWPTPPYRASTPPRLAWQNNKIRAATHNIMAYRIEQADRGTFLQVCSSRRRWTGLPAVVFPPGPVRSWLTGTWIPGDPKPRPC